MRLLILAKSDKKCSNGTKGFCVAGTTEDGRWVRLVSDEYGDAITDSACRFFNIGDSLTIDDRIITHCPLIFQPENYWVRNFNGISISSNPVPPPNANTDPYIFINNSHFLRTHDMERIGKSLILADVLNFRIDHDEHRKIKASFRYNNLLYEKMSITDPNYYQEQNIERAYIVVSLPPEPWISPWDEELYYKFVAAVYPM